MPSHKQKKLLPEPEAPGELEVLRQVCASFFRRRGLARHPRSLEDVWKAFEALRDGVRRGEMDATVIASYIYKHIAGEKVRKRKASAADFEEFLVTFFEGERVEEEDREKYLKKITGRGDFWRRVSRNRLEKVDVRLGDLLLSVKTLVPENLELNAGSFSAEALFSGFIEPVPQERTELGSKSALKSKFEKIELDGKWRELAERFQTMVESIFVTDWVIAVKGGRYLDVHTLDGEAFRKLLIDHVSKGPSEAVKLLNRFEAHALRVDVKPLLSKSRRVRVNLIGRSTPVLVKIEGFISQIRRAVILACTGALPVKEAAGRVQKAVKELVRLMKR